MNELRRFLVVDGEAKRIDDGITEKWKIAFAGVKTFCADVGADLILFSNSITAALFPGNAEPNNTWKLQGIQMEGLTLGRPYFTPNERTKAGKEIIKKMAAVKFPNAWDNHDFVKNQEVWHQFPRRKKSPSGKTIITLKSLRDGSFLELVDGFQEITEREYHMIMAEEPAGVE